MKTSVITGFLLLFCGYLTAQETIPYDCQIAFEGIDPTVDRYFKEMEAEDLFIYTPEELKLLVEKPLVEGRGNLVQTQGLFFFELKLKVNSTRARRDYGYIPQGNLIKFFLMDGTSFTSKNLADALPTSKEDKNAANYLASCGLSKEQVKMLRKSYVDRIGVVWTKGYEEYEFYNPDFFINQITCLK